MPRVAFLLKMTMLLPLQKNPNVHLLQFDIIYGSKLFISNLPIGCAFFKEDKLRFNIDSPNEIYASSL